MSYGGRRRHQWLRTPGCIFGHGPGRSPGIRVCSSGRFPPESWQGLAPTGGGRSQRRQCGLGLSRARYAPLGNPTTGRARFRHASTLNDQQVRWNCGRSTRNCTTLCRGLCRPAYCGCARPVVQWIRVCKRSAVGCDRVFTQPGIGNWQGPGVRLSGALISTQELLNIDPMWWLRVAAAARERNVRMFYVSAAGAQSHVRPADNERMSPE